jgi:hypothetical protein
VLNDILSSSLGAMTIPRFLRPPSLWFWLLPVLPVLSFAVCLAIMGFDLMGLEYFFPPFVAANQDSAATFFFLSSLAISALQIYVAWRTFRFLTKWQRIPRKTVPEMLAAYAISLLGFAAAILYVAVPIIPRAPSPNRRLVVHLSSLVTLSLFFITATLLFSYARHAIVDWRIWAFDGVTILVEIGYARMAFVIPKTAVQVAFTAILGYAALALSFARVPIHARTMLAAQFPLPWEKKPLRTH